MYENRGDLSQCLVLWLRAYALWLWCFGSLETFSRLGLWFSASKILGGVWDQFFVAVPSKDSVLFPGIFPCSSIRVSLIGWGSVPEEGIFPESVDTSFVQICPLVPWGEAFFWYCALIRRSNLVVFSVLLVVIFIHYINRWQGCCLASGSPDHVESPAASRRTSDRVPTTATVIYAGLPFPG